MSAPAFTPGPWIAERRKHLSVVLQTRAKGDGYSNRVAECPQWSPAPHPQPTPDEAFANACLIAKAPEMLALLIRYRTETPLGNQPHMIAHEADRVIAEARGESPSTHQDRDNA